MLINQTNNNQGDVINGVPLTIDEMINLRMAANYALVKHYDMVPTPRMQQLLNAVNKLSAAIERMDI